MTKKCLLKKCCKMALCWQDMEHSIVTLQRSLNAMPKSLGQQSRQINIFYSWISAGTMSNELLSVWWSEGFSCHLSGPTDSFPHNSAYWPSLQTVTTNQHGSVTFLGTLIWFCSTLIPDFSGSWCHVWRTELSPHYVEMSDLSGFSPASQTPICKICHRVLCPRQRDKVCAQPQHGSGEINVLPRG